MNKEQYKTYLRQHMMVENSLDSPEKYDHNYDPRDYLSSFPTGPIWDMKSTIQMDQVHIAQKGTHAERNELLRIHGYNLHGHALAALSIFGDDTMRARIANMHDWSNESSREDMRIRNGE